MWVLCSGCFLTLVPAGWCVWVCGCLYMSVCTCACVSLTYLCPPPSPARLACWALTALCSHLLVPVRLPVSVSVLCGPPLPLTVPLCPCAPPLPLTVLICPCAPPPPEFPCAPPLTLPVPLCPPPRTRLVCWALTARTCRCTWRARGRWAPAQCCAVTRQQTASLSQTCR